jgi:hypothetical protein
VAVGGTTAQDGVGEMRASLPRVPFEENARGKILGNSHSRNSWKRLQQGMPLPVLHGGDATLQTRAQGIDTIDLHSQARDVWKG